MAQPGEHDPVQGRARLPVAAVVEPTRTPTAGGVLDGAGSAKGGEGRLGVQQGDCTVRTDAHRYEQLWGVAFDEPGQALVSSLICPVS
ncbi:hypothetical protein [Streptomyces sp. XY152]|uniref:hypothetical protein n=1 Tax=Streptomyces sp. XY152 TaxID=1415560 RepID=UPI000AFB502E|nr:hypothetical protein [Streptomyces sp. XY152]